VHRTSIRIEHGARLIVYKELWETLQLRLEMSFPTEVQVLVVGAGPTGLASSIALANLGLQVVVVDAAPTNPVGSRASVVHSHTLEVSVVDLVECALE
jgi:ribulose 1,5-bisphosphate synthetase/thiazole synthase